MSEHDPVTKSYHMHALLTVCVAALNELEEIDHGTHPQYVNEQTSSIRCVLQRALETWEGCHDALEDFERQEDLERQADKEAIQHALQRMDGQGQSR